MKKKTTKRKGVVNESECIQALVINDLQSQIEQLKNEVKMLREASNPNNQKKKVEPIVVKQLPLKDFKFTAKNLIDHVIKTLIFNQFDMVSERHESYQKALDHIKAKHPYFVLDVIEWADDHVLVQVRACKKCPSIGSSDYATTAKETDWEHDGIEVYDMEPSLVIPSNLIDLDDCANTIVKLDDDCVFVETDNSSNGDVRTHISADDVGVNITHLPTGSYVKLFKEEINC